MNSNAENNQSLSFRHELKYCLNPLEMEKLRARLDGLMQQDTYAALRGGKYKIRSLYFDDYWNSAYEEKMMGINSRYKYRIRVYNDNDRDIHLEKKIKQGNYIAKQSAKLTRDGLDRILKGDYGFLLTDPQPLCKSFYHACTSHRHTSGFVWKSCSSSPTWGMPESCALSMTV